MRCSFAVDTAFALRPHFLRRASGCPHPQGEPIRRGPCVKWDVLLDCNRKDDVHRAAALLHTRAVVGITLVIYMWQHHVSNRSLVGSARSNSRWIHPRYILP